MLSKRDERTAGPLLNAHADQLDDLVIEAGAV
jgi:hypothetical protein